jgi:glucarate dehydratase
LALSQAAYVHLAASIPNMSISIDTERSYLASDISRSPVQLKNGAFVVPDAPGLGVEIDEAMIKAITVTQIKGAYLDDTRPGWFPTKPSY